MNIDFNQGFDTPGTEVDTSGRIVVGNDHVHVFAGRGSDYQTPEGTTTAASTVSPSEGHA